MTMTEKIHAGALTFVFGQMMALALVGGRTLPFISLTLQCQLTKLKRKHRLLQNES